MYFWLLLQIYPSDLRLILWSRIYSTKQHSQRANKQRYSFFRHSPSAVKTAPHLFPFMAKPKSILEKSKRTPCLDETSCLGRSLGPIETSAVTSAFIQPYSPDKSQQRKQAVPHRSPAVREALKSGKWPSVVCGKARVFLQLFGGGGGGGGNIWEELKRALQWKRWWKAELNLTQPVDARPSSHTSLWDTAAGVLIGVNYRRPAYWHTGAELTTSTSLTYLGICWAALKLKGLRNNAFHKMVQKSQEHVNDFKQCLSRACQ